MLDAVIFIHVFDTMIFMHVRMWGILGGPGAVLVKPSGVLGGSLGVPGRPCGRSRAPDITHTDISAFRILSFVSISFLRFLVF